MLAKITSLQDSWLAMSRGFDVDAVSLHYGMQSLVRVLEFEQGDFSKLASALVLSGESMRHTSRVASGSEHEVEKVLVKAGFRALHGQLVGFGTLVSALVYQERAGSLPGGLLWDSHDLFDVTRSVFEFMGVLDFALEPMTKLDEEGFGNLCVALTKASSVRKERHTLWNEVDSEELDWPELLAKLRARS